ncbi:cation:proton antiporter subunit C [Hyphobacterium sp. HN65]|uniref:Cation:proton antiporter subunit C n=1 Tax=Hyphobacterium lacteum TaxID=3116575 RepID=A0ABU7LT11_9PROT|nr:cation:proton antiporter subunit C [Hyphobacterium sp. HN65]MEE2527032.1 cation:proton antiporter subunit C [Hyphobacterium sp. HN65]
MVELLAERFNFIIVIILMMTGLYAVVATGNLVKRLVGLSLFQTSVFLLYITIGKVFGGQPPILPEYGGGHGESDYGAASTDHAAGAAEYAADTAHQSAEVLYSNPLPHVLILTAIVVGVATLSVGLALVVRIRETYGTIEDEAINKADYAVDSAGRGA